MRYGRSDPVTSYLFGWALTNITCDDSNSTGDTTTRTATFNLESGETVTCTFTNTRSAQVKVVKDLVPPTDGGLFNLQVNAATEQADATDGDDTGFVNVAVDSTPTVGEIAGTGTNLADYESAISCNNGDSGSGTSLLLSTLAAGDQVTCTITNTRRATLTVEKVTDPAVDDGLFDLFINATEHATDVADAGSTGAQFATIGANTFAEAAGTDTSLGDYISVVSGAGCGGTATAGTITLAAGENKTCTITNTRRATLTVTKVTDPAVDDGLFDLFINATEHATDVADAGSTGAQFATIGANTFAEAAGTDTSLGDYISVVSGAGCGGTATAGTITLAAGENKTCTITNTRRATLTVTKVTDPAVDDGLFDLFINATEHATDVADAGSTGAQFATIGANTFAEAAGTDTSLGDYISVVSGAGCGGTATAGTITLAAGENKTCTITNTRRATLTVTKVTDPAVDDGLFDLFINATEHATDVADAGSTGAQFATIGAKRSPGGRHRHEPWRLHQRRQRGGLRRHRHGRTITLAAGNKTCTITNTRRATLTDRSPTRPLTTACSTSSSTPPSTRPTSPTPAPPARSSPPSAPTRHRGGRHRHEPWRLHQRRQRGGCGGTATVSPWRPTSS